MEPSTLVRTADRRNIGALPPSAPVRAAVQAEVEQPADRALVLRMLNEALATEVMCVLRCQRQAFLARGQDAEPVAEDLIRHAAEAQNHVDRLLERIAQLGGDADASSESLAQRSQSEYVAGVTLRDMLREDLVAERMAVEGYRQMVDYLGDKDPATCRLLKDIVTMEVAHVGDLSALLSAHHLA